MGNCASSSKTTEDLLEEIYAGIDISGLFHYRNNMVDVKAAKNDGTNLLYGEILPEGVRLALDKNHMDVKKAKVVLDIGSGQGKLVFQLFHEFQNLERVVGVEISQDKFEICKQAFANYIQTQAFNSDIEELNLYSGRSLKNTKEMKLHTNTRHLEFYCDPISKRISWVSKYDPDIVFMDIAFSDMPQSIMAILNVLGKGTRLLTYENIKVRWPKDQTFPFKKTLHNQDRYKTTWQRHQGHFFFSWLKT